MTDFSQFPQLKNTHIIGLGHRARHGKDTVANVLLDLLGSRCRRFGFADALKVHCRLNHGMTTKDGALLQRIGTDVVRAQDVDTWLRPLYWTIQEWDENAVGRQVAVVIDVRFENEAGLIKHLQGDLVRVERLNEDGTLFQTSDRDPNHPSEISLAGYPWDTTIQASSRMELEVKAADYIKPITEILFAERYGANLQPLLDTGMAAVSEAKQ